MDLPDENVKLPKLVHKPYGDGIAPADTQFEVKDDVGVLFE